MYAETYTAEDFVRANTAELALPGRWCCPLQGVTTKSAQGERN